MNYISRTMWLVAASLLVSTTAWGATKPLVKYADKKFSQFDFYSAIELYQRASRKDNANIYLTKQIATCYRLLNDPVSAEPYYKKLVADKSAEPSDKLYYAEILRSNQKYPDAIKAYESYLAATESGDSSVVERIEGLKKVDALKKDKETYYWQNAGINSPNSDFGVSFYLKNSILFSSNRDQRKGIRRTDLWTGAGFLKIYTTTQTSSGSLPAPTLLKGKGLNKKFHEGPACYDRTRNELYITRCNQVKKKQHVLKLKLYKVSCDTATGQTGKDMVEAVSFNSNDYSVMHPTITADGKMMFFASDMKVAGAQGGMDLYVSTREGNGAWGTPQNLGPNINTNGDEMFPFISADSILYFASNGHAGLGGLDVYLSFPLSDGGWSRPRNLGYPINTSYDDFGYVIDETNTNGYFSSNRTGGQGDDDIYRFTTRGGMVFGQVIDAVDLHPLDKALVAITENDKTQESQITMSDGTFCFSVKDKHYYKLPVSRSGYINEEREFRGSMKRKLMKVYLLRADTMALFVDTRDSKTKKPVANADGVVTDIRTGVQTPFVTDSNGYARLTVYINSKYKVDIMQKNVTQSEFYFSQSRDTTTDGKSIGDSLRIGFDLVNNNINVAVNLKNIYFDLDKWNLRADSKKELNKIVKIMTEHPTWEIVVAAHTDCRNTEAYNLELSGKRAESVVNYLVANGIPAVRMIAVGYGEMRLVNHCECENGVAVPCTEAQHALNRRIEFRINKL